MANLIDPGIGLSIRNKNICTAVTSEEKAAFQAFCEERGMTPSEMLRLMLSKVCQGIEPGEQQARVRKQDALYLRLRSEELAEVRRRAKLEGTTGPNWVRRVVLAVIRKAPSYTRGEETALTQSNYELAAIGRNINQIAHHLNIHRDATDAVSTEILVQLAENIQRHRALVVKLVNASWGRYSLDELDVWAP